jgi:hypothetical protein
MKIISSLFEEIAGIQAFPIISMFIFLAFFAGILVYAAKLDNKLSEQMRHLPLEGDENLINDND